MQIYEFLYNPCLSESGWVTISIHKTREGAQKTLEEHKTKEKESFNKMIENDEDIEHWNEYPYDFDKDWNVREIELKD